MDTPRRDGTPEDPFEAIGCGEVAPIGSGGSSLVYRARQRSFDRLIALKVLSTPLTDERSRRRFERELALAGRLTGHPNVVTVFASGFLADGRPYVEMEYCPGGSLADRMAATGAFPVRDVVSIGVKIAGVLELARLEGIVHRDVKPANVLLTRFGEPALADFGIAVISGEITGTTQALTPVHAAPEVLESRAVGSAADQWSLGSTLHTLLAGRAPFASDDEQGLLAGMLRILNDPVPSLPRADVPATLRAVLTRAMAKAPEDRWPTPGELGKALQEVEQSEDWPVTALSTEEVPESRYTPSGQPSTGNVGPPSPGSAGPGGHEQRPGLDPRSTYAVPGDQVAGPAGPGGHQQGLPWSSPPPSARPSAPAGAGIWPTPAVPTPPGPPAPDDHDQSGQPAPPGGPGPPAGGFSPAPAAGEITQHWTRRPVVVDHRPGPAEAQRPSPKVWVAAGSVVVVGVAVVVGLLVTRSPSLPRSSGHPVVPPSHPSPAAAYAPVGLHVMYEGGTSVTLAWRDPNNGQYPFVVQVISPKPTDPAKTNSATQTVVAGLRPGTAYCFTVGALYAPTLPPAYATAVCTAGATASTGPSSSAAG